MADLDIDTATLEEAGASLRVVATEFAAANARSDSAAGATGHPELAEHVRDFAHSWDDRRKKILAEISGLALAATEVGETFGEVEASFVAALQGRTP